MLHDIHPKKPIDCILKLKYHQDLIPLKEALFMTNTFTAIDSIAIQKLEKEIAYFYDVHDPEPVACHYMQAITNFEKEKTINKKTETVPHFVNAYQEVKKQKKLNFDVNAAAEYEYDLIVAQATHATTEKIVNIMVKIYQTVFCSDDPSIRLIAELRTFLYRYKVYLIKHSTSPHSAG